MTVVMVLHDINQTAQYSNRLIVLKRGTIHYDGIPHYVMCKEMFQKNFEIDADIYEQNGRSFFTPMRLCKEQCQIKGLSESHFRQPLLIQAIYG